LEVVPVLGLAQPATLTGRFALPTSARVWTIVLMVSVAVIRAENLTAMTAFRSA